MEDEKLKAVEKTLGEPVATDFSDYVRKIRNNLIFISFISIAICLGGLHLSPESSFLGLKFIGLNNELILQGIFYLNLYFLIHFLWCSIDHLQEWRLRVTGTKVGFIAAAAYTSEEGDYPSNPRQSSLYNWWKSQAMRISSLTEPLNDINTRLSAWEQKVNDALKDKDYNVVSACSSIKAVSEDIAKLKSSIESIEKTLTSLRIPASLKRFDNWFLLFLRSQNLRWLVIELILPILASLFAALLLWQKL